MEIEELEPEEVSGQVAPPRKIKEHRVPIDHESFYDGRVFGETKSRATVHMEVSYQYLKSMVIPWSVLNMMKMPKYLESF